MSASSVGVTAKHECGVPLHTNSGERLSKRLYFLEAFEEFTKAVTEWREKHRLKEDEAVLLLVELFRIHQRHWDELRRREIPAFSEFRADIGKLADAARTFQVQSSAFSEAIRDQPMGSRSVRITRAAAIFAALAALLAGYLIGRAW